MKGESAFRLRLDCSSAVLWHLLDLGSSNLLKAGARAEALEVEGKAVPLLDILRHLDL